jgi:regulator of sigma E protease
MAGTSYESGGWNAFFRLMAILSITLAALNILPIPVLDGGHLFFYVIEVIKGSPVRLKVRMMATQVGFYMLMALMVLVFYVDINRFFVDKVKALFN